MATGIYDFEGLAESANPVGNGWTLSLSGGSWTSQIVLGTTPVGTRFWRQTAGGEQTAYLTWTSSGNPAWNNTIEILSLWRRADTARPFRASPAAFRVLSSSADAYYVSLSGSDNRSAQIRRRVNGSDSFVTAGVSLNVANQDIGNDWHWVRFQLIWTGSTNELRTKYWRYNEDEPSAWRETGSHADLTSTQTFGMMPAFTASSQQQDIAWFSVGTGPDSAPGPQEDTGLAFTTAPTVTSRTTDSYTIGGTANQDCTVFAVATATTATDPDGPQIAAGTDGDDAAAPGTGSVAATADTAFSLSITGTFTEATHDIHIVARREAE
jgi:hypothetical protein